jgi:hypothetical protein
VRSPFSINEVRRQFSSGPTGLFLGQLREECAKLVLAGQWDVPEDTPYFSDDTLRSMLAHVAFGFGNHDEAAVRLLCLSGEGLPDFTQMRDREGVTPIHWAAGHGKLGRLPSVLYGRTSLAVAAHNGDTPLHYAARGGDGLNFFPSTLLTPALLWAKNNEGETAVVAAAQADHFDQIPANLLSPELLLTECNCGSTALWWLRQREKLYQLPSALRHLADA